MWRFNRSSKDIASIRSIWLSMLTVPDSKFYFLPRGYIRNWNGNIMRFDIKVCPGSLALGKRGSHTRIPWTPQKIHSASVKWGLSLRLFVGTHTCSTHDASTVGGAHCNLTQTYFYFRLTSKRNNTHSVNPSCPKRIGTHLLANRDGGLLRWCC